MDPWHDATVDQEAGHLHLLGRSGVNTWSLKDGDVKLVKNNSIPESGKQISLLCCLHMLYQAVHFFLN